MTYPQGEDSHGKLWVILDNLPDHDRLGSNGCDSTPGSGLHALGNQLVGEVTAHQGFDA